MSAPVDISGGTSGQSSFGYQPLTHYILPARLAHKDWPDRLEAACGIHVFESRHSTQPTCPDCAATVPAGDVA